MSVEKRGKVWRVSYRHNGKQYKETFETEKQANARDAIIKMEKEAGNFEPPHHLVNAEAEPAAYGKGITIRELMERVVTEYGPSEWKPNTLAQNKNRINYYIIPLIGNETLMELTVPQLERFYKDL